MKNYNLSINQDLNRIFDLKGENTAEVADFIQPVREIEPRINIARSASAINSTAGTIYATPSDKDFYLTSASLSVIKDVTSTSLRSDVQVVIDGVTQSVLRISGITLTVQADSISQSYPISIKVDRGTNITVTNTTNVGNVTASGCIQGYTQETTKGV